MGNADPRGGRRPRSILFPLVFLLFTFVLVRLDLIPFPILFCYSAVSLVTFLIYAADKHAARGNRRRISERTLHLASLFGGWPGAALAQRVLHHKSQKAPFLRLYRLTVLLNCACLVLTGVLWATWRLP
ncbi:MAG: DUF1294 domain-containing protein [Geobacter sp.]|nr:MAG: DUF1294 domain-containing protein [Geobacter sp.]